MRYSRSALRSVKHLREMQQAREIEAGTSGPRGGDAIILGVGTRASKKTPVTATSPSTSTAAAAREADDDKSKQKAPNPDVGPLSAFSAYN